MDKNHGQVTRPDVENIVLQVGPARHTWAHHLNQTFHNCFPESKFFCALNRPLQNGCQYQVPALLSVGLADPLKESTGETKEYM